VNNAGDIRTYDAPGVVDVKCLSSPRGEHINGSEGAVNVEKTASLEIGDGAGFEPG